MKGHHLTEESQADRDDFEREFRNEGCTCFMSPPCAYCTHPGNPLNQEVAECWEPDAPPVTASRNKREGWYAGRRGEGYFFSHGIRTKHIAYALKYWGKPTPPEA